MYTSKPIKYIIYWGQTFSLISSYIILRNIIEILLKRSGGLEITSFDVWVNCWLHFPIFYLSIWVTISNGFYLITSVNVRKSYRICSIFMLIILIGPLFDAITGNATYPYLYLKNPDDIKFVFVNFFNPFTNLLSYGITNGPRVEITVAVLCSIFIMLKNIHTKVFQKLITIILSSFFLYITIYFFCAWPAIISLFLGVNTFSDLTPFIYIRFFLIIISINIFVILTIQKKYFIKYIYPFLRVKRLLHYLLLCIIGIIFFLSFNNLSIFDKSFYFIWLLKILTGLFALVFIFIASTILNDFTDFKEDYINGKCIVNDNNEFRISIVFIGISLFFLSLIFGFSTGITEFFIILVWYVLTIIYSAPPLRLKRIPVVSNLVLAVAAVLSVLYGSLISGSVNQIREVPQDFLIIVFLFSFFGSFIKDLPDMRGDTSVKVITLPVVLNPAKYSFLYSLSIMIFYIIIVLVIPSKIYALFLLLPMLFGIIGFIKKPYENKSLFIMYYVSILFISIIYIV